MPSRASVVTLALFACAASAASAAFAQDQWTQQVDAQFEAALPQLQSRGLSPRQQRRYGSLAQGASDRFATSVDAVPTLVVGFCDNDCSNLDLVLLDSGGSVVDSDLLDDDYPIVSAHQPGSYTVEVRMTACAAAPCRYAVQLFSP